MPKDTPKAALVLLWLLSGVIIFGWLLMEYTATSSFIFALAFFGLPVLVHKIIKKEKI